MHVIVTGSRQKKSGFEVFPGAGLELLTFLGWGPTEKNQVACNRKPGLDDFSFFGGFLRKAARKSKKSVFESSVKNGP